MSYKTITKSTVNFFKECDRKTILTGALLAAVGVGGFAFDKASLSDIVMTIQGSGHMELLMPVVYGTAGTGIMILGLLRKN